MKSELVKHPTVPAGKKSILKYLKGQIKDKILRRDLHGKFDEEFVAEVLSMMPVKCENTLNNHRVSVLGKVPKTRDDYNPSQVLSTISDREKIIVADSNDLPPNWKECDLTDLLKELEEGDGAASDVLCIM